MKNFNLTSIKPYVKIGILLTVIIVVVLLITIITSPKTKKVQEYTPDVPRSVVPVKIVQPPTFQSELSKLRPILPYKNNNLSITYKDYMNAVVVEVSAQNKTEYLASKKQAEDFIKSKGVANICSLNIFWIPKIPRENRMDIQGGDVATTNCPPYKP